MPGWTAEGARIFVSRSNGYWHSAWLRRGVSAADSRADLGSRSYPRFRPGDARAARHAISAHLGPGLGRRNPAVELHLGRAGGEEGAEDPKGAAVKAGRHIEDEWLGAVEPSEDQPIATGRDVLCYGRPRIASPRERRVHDRKPSISERREGRRLNGPVWFDRALQPSRNRGIIAIDPEVTSEELGLDEEGVANTSRTPQ